MSEPLSGWWTTAKVGDKVSVTKEGAAMFTKLAEAQELVITDILRNPKYPWRNCDSWFYFNGDTPSVGHTALGFEPAKVQA